MRRFLVRALKILHLYSLTEHILETKKNRNLGKAVVSNTRTGYACEISRGAIVVNSSLEDYAHVSPHAYVRDSRIGTYSSIGVGSVVYFSNIGKYCDISWYCVIGARSHPYNTFANSERFPIWANNNVERPEEKQSSIGNDVWVGANSVIMPRVSIGNGAIIGAGAVVTRDVPPYAIVTGVPAAVVKYRFSPDIIARLLEIAWWNWKAEKVKAFAYLLEREVNAENLELLIAKSSDNSSPGISYTDSKASGAVE